MTWRGKRYEFGGNKPDAVVYGEKNWGSKFPSKWFWLQANSGWRNNLGYGTDGTAGKNAGVVTLTVAGGRRAVPIVGEQEVALIALHLDEGMDFD